MLLIGVVDSGCPPAAPWLAGQKRFFVHEGYLYSDDSVPDASGHGTEVIDVIRGISGSAHIMSAQVLDAQGRSSTDQVAAAMDWLLSSGVKQINLSLGFVQDEPSLRQVFSEAVANDVIVVASCPTMGQPVYPASYPGILSVTGDARLQPTQWSWFQAGQQGAEYGGHVAGPSGQAGASIACAHVTGIIGAFRETHPQATLADVVRHLQRHASRVGPQKREPLRGLQRTNLSGG